MAPHEQRVVEEKHELDTKLEKLEAFLEGEVFRSLEHADQSLLTRQRATMRTYSNILKQRIERFATSESTQ